MFLKHLKLAYRHLLKTKGFSAIKLTGLAAGFLGCLLIGLFIQHEMSYDSCHARADRIVRVTMEYHSGGETINSCNTGNMVAPTLKAEFPEVENATRLIKYDDIPVKYGDKVFEESDFYYADSTVFDIFTFPLLAGDAQTALAAPNKLVIDASSAEKYFGSANPLGQTLYAGGKAFEVSGVMADVPSNSQAKPRFIASFVSHRDAAPERSTWWSANYGTYLLLHRPDGRQAMEAKIGPFMRSRTSETRMSGDDYLTYHFEPLRDVHLRSAVEGNFEPNGDIRYIYLLSTVGLLILFIGITTYVNLTTASSMERAKEVGVQKVLGAGRRQLLQQHLGEAGILTAIALLSGLMMAPLLLPAFNRLFGSPLSAQVLWQPEWLLGLLVLGLAITLLSGAYPAWAASKFDPIDTLKSGPAASHRASGGNWLRSSLVVFQFAISVFLLASTIILQGQMDFIRQKNLGYDKGHVLALPTDGQVIEKLSAFKSEFLQNDKVHAVSLAYETPTHIEGGYGISKTLSDENGQPVTALPADEDFLAAMGISLAAGSNFTHQDVEAVQRMYQGDTTVVRSILLNEKQAADFDWTPEEAAGQYVNFNGRKCLVKGVVKDFHFASLHEPIGNLVIFPDTWGNVLLVKSSGQELASTLAFLSEKWRQLAPHRPFSYHFLDEEFDTMYQAEIQSSRLVTAGCGLAIFLACLGLFGLAAITVVNRTKEIGIRKVLGASVSGIIGLLSADFLRLVLLAIMLGAPLAYYLMGQWLAGFTYRIDIHWWMIALAGAGALLVAFITISFQSVRAALANPSDSLRSE